MAQENEVPLLDTDLISIPDSRARDANVDTSTSDFATPSVKSNINSNISIPYTRTNLSRADIVKDGISESHSSTDQPLIIPPTTFILIFTNPRSGNRQGKALSTLDIQHYRLRSAPEIQVQIYDFLDEEDRKTGVEYLRRLMRREWKIEGSSISSRDRDISSSNKTIWGSGGGGELDDIRFHVWSAGGDGTFMSVIEALINGGVDIKDNRLAFSVLPFGTGNDLSQVKKMQDEFNEINVEIYILDLEYIFEKLNG